MPKENNFELSCARESIAGLQNPEIFRAAGEQSNKFTENKPAIK
jgi:hypothetical protein